MSLRIGWASNNPNQFTGYSRLARSIVPYLQKHTDHDFVLFSVSGMENQLPYEWKGMKVYGRTKMGGELGTWDIPVVNEKESIDLWMLNYDVWAIGKPLSKLDISYCLYSPIDHDPLQPVWKKPMMNALEIVPYCKFGRRVISEGLQEMDEEGEIITPHEDRIFPEIYHGVDTSVFKPVEVSKEEVMRSDPGGLGDNRDERCDEDTFVVGIFKNNQGTRWQPVRHLRAFKLFYDRVREMHGKDAKVMLYLHSAIQGSHAYDMRYVMNITNTGNLVRFVNPSEYRFGLPDEELNKMYNACDVVLNCTAGEGFGFPLIEAMATGTPVIALAFSSMPELLNDEEGEIRQRDFDGSFIKAKRGWLVPTWDVEPTIRKYSWRRKGKAEHIANALIDAYENRDSIDRSGLREFAKVKCDWKVVNNKWAVYFNGMEDRLFEVDEDTEIKWGKLTKESGGVGALR